MVYTTKFVWSEESNEELRIKNLKLTLIVILKETCVIVNKKFDNDKSSCNTQ